MDVGHDGDPAVDERQPRDAAHLGARLSLERPPTVQERTGTPPSTFSISWERFPGAILLSAHAPEDVAALRQAVLDFFEAQMVEAELLIPYASQGRVGEVYETARVLSETFDEVGRCVRVRSMPGAIAKLIRKFQR
jgi:50S ribosomal subunit-associated GTPase HflX